MPDLFNNICGYKLDEEQQNVVLDNIHNLLVIAGAGSGKTLTIIAKIRYLIEVLHYQPDEILCISFTNETCNSLKNKLKNYYNYDIEVLTFHKVALNILKENNLEFNLAYEDELEIVVDIFLNTTIYSYPFLIKCLLKYYHISFKEKNYLKKYQKFLNSQEFKNLTKLIIRFIHLLKAHNIFSLKEFIKNPYQNNDLFLLLVIYACYLEYEKELYAKNTYDFDDLIIKAQEIIFNNSGHYKYIIVDEYQDTSIARYNLLNALVKKNKALLMVVGDDYQSIYHFSGCKLNIFLDFSHYFANTKIYYLNHTYRCSQELITTASFFICQNPHQIKKKLQSLKEISHSLNIIYYQKRQKELTKLIYALQKEGSLLILGRNNFDIFKFLDLKIFKIAKDGYISGTNINNTRFLTVHKAKGLESDNVIIINLENDLYGFPSQIKNENILNYVNNLEENFKYAEERRLFYVALTRAKKRVYLYTSKQNPSIFIKEIKRIKKKFK